MSTNLYVRYCELGYLDSGHTMGIMFVILCLLNNNVDSTE
jgi:hypothetical protein